MKVLSYQNESIDALCFRVYGHTDGAVEAVLLANPNLAHEGVFLPAGIWVEIPSLPLRVAKQTVKLWD